VFQQIHGIISDSCSSDGQLVSLIDSMLLELGDVKAEPII
jgi:hypothetical protein